MSLQLFNLLWVGALIGGLQGVTGAGGGILAVPALVAVLGWGVLQAGPVALLGVAGSAALGAWDGFRQGLVRYRAALLMACAGVPASWLGSLLAHYLPGRLLLALFALVMLWTAWRLLHRQADGGVLPESLCPLHPDTGRFVWPLRSLLLISGVGALAGLMTGLLGVGGGFIIVPALRRVSPLPMHSIAATSLLVIALVGAGGVVMASLHGLPLPMEVALPFLLATLAGMLVGRRLSRCLSPAAVQRGFIGLLCVIAGYLLLKSLALV